MGDYDMIIVPWLTDVGCHESYCMAVLVDPNPFTPTGVVYISIHLSKVHVRSSCSERVCMCVFGEGGEGSAVTVYYYRDRGNQIIDLVERKGREGWKEIHRVTPTSNVYVHTICAALCVRV